MKYLKVASIAFFDSNNHVLLNQRRDASDSKTEIWEIIGGGIENGELPMEAIKREIKEELNYMIDEVQDNLSFVKKINMANAKFEAEVHFFKAAFPGIHRFKSSSEVNISDLKLFSVDNALQLNLLPICREILLSLQN